jgi:CelD/BcsL family acetyltransferase involved in cellulose biosynthesis
MRQQQYRTEKIVILDASLIKQWKQLWKKAVNASVFNSYEWFLTYQKSHVTREFYVCYQGETLVAILPLRKTKKFGVSVLTALGGNFLVESAFLVERYDKALLSSFFQQIFFSNTIFLPKIDEQAVVLLSRIFPQLFFTVMSVNPILPISVDSFNVVSKSTLRQIRKVLKHNEGKYTFVMYTGKDVEKQMTHMFSIDKKSAKSTRAMDIFSKKENRDAFLTMSKQLSKYVCLGFLSFDGKPIAYQFGFMYQGTFAAYQTSYLVEYRKIRPGKLLFYYLIKYLQELGIQSLDLGGGISTYKQEFTPEYRVLYDLYFSSNNAIVFWWKFINWIRRKKQIVFKKKFTRDHEFLFKTL